MLLRFREEFDLPPAEVYGCFRTPADWPRIFGFAGPTRALGEGWYEVPLKRFPFPLVGRIVRDEPERLVRWEFRGFWKGEGEVRLAPRPDGGVVAEGFERIGVRWLGPLSWILEKLALERGFRAVWAVGWHRLRKRERERAGRATTPASS